MYLHHRFRLAVLASLASAAVLATTASAQFPPGFLTGFEVAGPTEPVGYTTGSLQFQDGWDLGSAGRSPRIQTAAEISAELTAAGLNPANPTHGGDQALLLGKIDTTTEVSPPGGYLVRDIFTGLESERYVTVDFWARPLTSGIGADNLGTAGNGKTIGERQGNTFVGVADSNNETRAAAVRFGVDTVGADPYTNVVERHIDFASASAGSAVWVKSGLTWVADAWYNLRFELDYQGKNYDFYVNDVKVNGPAIPFYTVTSQAATRFFVSRGTNQAGQIIDDVSITAAAAPAIDPGDFNSDGVIDGADFLIWQRDTSLSFDDWKSNFGVTAVAAGSGVPEPTSAVLALGILLGAGGVLRKRGNRAAI